MTKHMCKLCVYQVLLNFSRARYFYLCRAIKQEAHLHDYFLVQATLNKFPALSTKWLNLIGKHTCIYELKKTAVLHEYKHNCEG